MWPGGDALPAMLELDAVFRLLLQANDSLANGSNATNASSPSPSPSPLPDPAAPLVPSPSPIPSPIDAGASPAAMPAMPAALDINQVRWQPGLWQHLMRTRVCGPSKAGRQDRCAWGMVGVRRMSTPTANAGW